MSEVLFQQIDRTKQEEVLSTQSLLGEVYGSETMDLKYLCWLYDQNPEGSVVGFEAIDSKTGTKVGHYATIPISLRLFGVATQALLSLNTATHPNFQGKGLFTKLAEMTYELASARGFSAVVGISNANSTPGFVKKLGFQLVSPLAARIGPSFLRNASIGTQNGQSIVSRIWNHESLKWRLLRPRTRYFRSGIKGCWVASDTHIKGVQAILAPIDSELTQYLPHKASPFSLTIGLQQERVLPISIDIPNCFRPSPLNFIYRPLSVDSPKTLKPTDLSWSNIDFDAY